MSQEDPSVREGSSHSNGVLKPSEKLNLREGEKVEIEIRKKPQKIVSLRGIWKNIQISEEDIEKAKHISLEDIKASQKSLFPQNYDL